MQSDGHDQERSGDKVDVESEEVPLQSAATGPGASSAGSANAIREMFSPKELCDIHYIYGFCNGNARAARAEYQLRFPNRRLPKATTFSTTHQRLSEGTLFDDPHRHSIDRGATNTIKVQTQDKIIQLAQRYPDMSMRCIAKQLNASLATVSRVLHDAASEEGILLDKDARRRKFCATMLEKDFKDETFLERILWTDEVLFTETGLVRLSESPVPGRDSGSSVYVWAGVLGNELFGPYIFDQQPRLTAKVYLQFLQNDLPILLENVPLSVRRLLVHQHNGTHPNFDTTVRSFLVETFRNRRISRYGHIKYPPRSADLSPLHSFVWRSMKKLVYAGEEITSSEQLKVRIREAAESVRSELASRNVIRSVKSQFFKELKVEG